MNILYVCTFQPGDLSSGAAQRTTLLYEALAEMGDVYTVIPVRKKHQEKVDAEKRIAWLSLNRGCPFSHFINQLCRQNLMVLGYHASGVVPRLKDVWPNIKFDFGVCRYAATASVARLWHYMPWYLDVDDLPLELFSTLHKDAFLFSLKKRLVQWYSNWIFKHANGLWFANPQQEKLLPNVPKRCLPNITLKQEAANVAPVVHGPSIFSVGNLSYAPNADGIRHFVLNVWPLVHRQCPNLEYRIGGKGLPDDVVEICKMAPGVKLLGFVDDLAAEYANSLFVVAPVYAGGGTCIKILEALSYGRLCICNAFAARGIDKEQPGFNCIIVTDDDEDFAEKIIHFVQNDSEREKLQRQCLPSDEDLQKARQDFNKAVHALLAAKCITETLT
ncbi:MAG: glycosyltransferase family 4 protein [Victivallales bacterium]|nr:glycosyltransferase family 4 protein [Victivallales bacterium]